MIVNRYRILFDLAEYFNLMSIPSSSLYQPNTVSVSENPLQGGQAGTVSISQNPLPDLLSNILSGQPPIDSDVSSSVDDISSKRIDLEATNFEIDRIKKLLSKLQKEKNEAEKKLFFATIKCKIVDKCNFLVVIPLTLFHEITTLFSEPLNNPLLGISLLKHIIDNSTVEINREWAQCFLALAVLRGDVIAYDCREMKSSVYRIQNHSNPKLADECMIDVKTKCVRKFYKNNLRLFLLEFAPSAYSESAQRYIQEHKIQPCD